jgi:hypothetical protein
MEIVAAAIVLVVVVVVATVVAILVAVNRASKRAQQERERRHAIEESGIRATAEILKSEFVMTDPSGSVAMFDLSLRVHGPDGQLHVVDECKGPSNLPGAFPVNLMLADAVKKAGTVVPVRLAPDDPTYVLIDQDQLRLDLGLDG